MTAPEDPTQQRPETGALPDRPFPAEPGAAGEESPSAGRADEPREVPRGPSDESPAPLFLGRGGILALLAWGVAVLAVTAGIAGETAYWFAVPVVGAAAPLALLALQGRALRTREDRATAGAASGVAHAEGKEKELLVALREHAELSPAAAAVLTTLTVSEAAGMLEKLSRRGHLEARAREGSLFYALREGDRRALQGTGKGTGSTEPAADDPAPDTPAPDPPEETPPSTPPSTPAPTPTRVSPGPGAERLSERELEVLGLLASGRTNREIAGELFLAVGTVKAHANNVYRKLGARNRAEAVSRARDLGLLR